MATVTISTKGQVVIPASWREELGLLPGKLAQIIKTGAGVFVKPAAKDPIEAFFGKFAGLDLYGALKRGRKIDQQDEKRLLKRNKQ